MVAANSSASLSFRIERACAWAPGCEQPAQWRAWAAAKEPLGQSGQPDVSYLPAMMRRRLSPLAKMAVHVAWQCLDPEESLPVVFASRHGDCQRTLHMLLDIARGEPLSPTAFSLSVHNAVAGLFSLLRKDQAVSTALAGGRDTWPLAMVEALAQVQERRQPVLLVYYEAPLPTEYAPFYDEQPFAAAIALRLAPATGADSMTVSRSAAADTPPEDTDVLPEALPVQWLRWFYGDTATLALPGAGGQWQWRRDVAA